VGHSLGHSFVGVIRCAIFLRVRWVISLGSARAGVIRWVIVSYAVVRVSLGYFVGCMWASLPFSCGLFLVVLVGIRSEDLGRGVLEGNFCTVERL
jgi:ABC-type Mn2+/Zn2+ transport system permease subunit